MKDGLKILYVAPRYHTNQIPIMKGWNDFGAEVSFLAQYEGIGEKHDYVHYQNMKPSFIFKVYSSFIDRFVDKVKSENLKIKHYVPSFFGTLFLIKNIKPDIVIIREFTKGNAVVSMACKFLNIKNVIMYVQTPLYGVKPGKKKLRILFRKLMFPSVVFTPVFYKDDRNGKRTIGTDYDQPKWFVPLVYEYQNNRHYRSQQYSEKIQIIDIGKYREYKNHYYLVDAISNIQDKSKIKVTIIGQLSNDAEIKYYNDLQDYIINKGLNDVIELRGHVPYEEMDKIYNNSDILVLCSKNETAGMVILEGMAHGLCVISSINCGLASYLEEYNCGFTYSLETPFNLSSIIDKIIEDPDVAVNMGNKAAVTVENQFDFKSYFDHLNEITKKEFDLDLHNSIQQI